MRILNTLFDRCRNLRLWGLAFLFPVLSLALSSCNNTYNVGDYYKLDGNEGVVVSVDASGNPTLLLAAREIADIDADSALGWAATLDNGWQLPDKSQIALVLKYKSLINNTLIKRKLPPVLVNHTFYWTADTCSRAQHYACGPNGIRCYFHSSHSPRYRARAVLELKIEN